MTNNDSNTVVSFSADTANLEAGVNKAGNTLSGFTNGTGSIFEKLKSMVTGHVDGINESIAGITNGPAAGLGSLIEGITSKLAGIGVLLAGGALFAEGIKAFSDETAETKKLMNGLGMTAEAASKFNTELKIVGMSSEQYVGIAMKFDRQLKTNEDGLKALGVTTRDGNGKLLDQQTLLQNAANTMMTYKAGVDRNEVAMTMFGRSADSAYALLKLNEKTSERAAELTKAYGLELDEVSLRKAKDYKIAIGEAKLAGESFTAHLGEAVMPMLTSMAKGFTDVAIVTMPYVNSALSYSGLFLEAFGRVAKKVVDSSIDLFSSLGKKVQEVFVTDAPKATEGWATTYQMTAGNIERWTNGMVTAMDWLVMKIKEVGNDFSAIFSGALTGTDEGEAKLKRYMAADEKIRAEGNAAILKDEKDFQAAIKKLREGDAPNPPKKEKKNAPTAPGKGGKGGKGGAEQSYVPHWDAQLADAKVYYAATHNLREYSKQDEIDFWQSALDQTNLTEQERLEINRKVSRLRLEIQKEERKEAIGLATESIKAEQAAAIAGLAQEEEMAKTRHDLDQTTFDEYQAQLISFENRRYEIEKAAMDKMIELDKQSPNNAVKVKQEQDKQLAQASAHGLAIQKIEDTTTKEAAKKWQELFKFISDGFGNAIAGFIVGTKSLSQAMTGIYSTIQSAFESMIGKMIAGYLLEQAAGLIGLAAKKKEIPATAVSAGAKSADAVADIPFAGPALAIAAYAATYGTIMDGMASAAGGYDIPAGVNPITQLHQNEMVLPAHLADTVRNMAGGNGAGSRNGDVHLHVSSVDAHSVRRLFQDNGAALADSLKHQMRNLKR